MESDKVFIEKMQQTNKNTKKYCHLKQEIQQLSDVIRYQKAISNSHVIPRQYKPKPVFISQPNSGKLQQSFDVQYEKIFFEHLSRVIKENEIDIGIKQARLDSLIRTVEKTPTDSELCDSAAQQGNQHLISEARLKNYTPSLNAQTKLLKNQLFQQHHQILPSNLTIHKE